MNKHGVNRQLLRKQYSPVRFRSEARSHAGVVRKINEDAYAARNTLRLWAVADGIGGHACGDIASRMLAEAMAAIDADSEHHHLPQLVEAQIQKTHAAMVEQSREKDHGALMGSTISVLMGGRDSVQCIWAGDSRVYRHRDGMMTRLTHDHSVVQQLIDSGAIDEAAARKHPHKNVITSAVGAQDKLSLERRTHEFAAGDKFLLCTDGLSNMLTDYELCSLISSGPIDETADLLLATALARGAGDNVTFVLVESIGDSGTQRDEY